MSWFKRKDKKIEESTNKKDLPSDLWIKGTCCGEILYKPELEKANSICHHCNFHYPISSDKYLKIILDHKSKSFKTCAALLLLQSSTMQNEKYS